MRSVRPIPVAITAVVVELILAVVGAELNYQLLIHRSSHGLTSQVLVNAIGVTWRPPWHRGFSYDGTKLTIALIAFLVLLFLLTWLIVRCVRGDRAFIGVFFAVWGAIVGAQVDSSILRYLLLGDEYFRGQSDRTALILTGSANITHTVYFGWITALIAALVAVLTRTPADPSVAGAGAPGPGYGPGGYANPADQPYGGHPQGPTPPWGQGPGAPVPNRGPAASNAPSWDERNRGRDSRTDTAVAPAVRPDSEPDESNETQVIRRPPTANH